MRMISLFTTPAAYWQAARARRIATRELAVLSACELGDMGITRLDLSRLFEPDLTSEFGWRGSFGRGAPTAAFKPLPQRSVLMTSLESLA